MSVSNGFASIAVALAVTGLLSGCVFSHGPLGQAPDMSMMKGETTVSNKHGKIAHNLDELEPGHPLGYYNYQFQAMGFDIRDIDRYKNRVVYDLVRDTQFYRVALHRLAGEEAVEDIRINRYQYTQGKEAIQNQDYKLIKELVSQVIKPGKPVNTYITRIEQQIGRVVEIESDADKTNLHLEARGNEYVVELDVEPTSRVVRNVKLTEAFRGG